MASTRAPQLELDSVSSFKDTRWLNESSDEEGAPPSRSEQSLPNASRSTRAHGSSATASRDVTTGPKSSVRSKKQAASAVKSSKQAQAAADKATLGDELALSPGDALKLKLIVEATAPALLHFRKGSRQIPFQDIVPRDPTYHSPTSILPNLVETDDASVDAHFTLLKQSWPLPERIERLKAVAIVQLPRDLEAEADQADLVEQDTFATLSDALEAALVTAPDLAERDGGEAHADESREEEDFVRLRNVIFLISSIRRQFLRLLRNPSAPSGFLQPDQLGRHLPHLRHKEFRIISQPAVAKSEEEAPASLPLNAASAGAPGASLVGVASTPSAPAPMALTRADTALTTLWTQVWFTEILRGSTLVLSLLNELAQRKSQEQSTPRLVARMGDGTDEADGADPAQPSRKRARHQNFDPSAAKYGPTRRTNRMVPPKVAMHMRLGVFGDMFTNATDMPRKFWERHYAAAAGQFAAEGEDGGEVTTEDEDGAGSDEEHGAIGNGRRRARARKGSHGPGHAPGGASNGPAALNSALIADKKGRPKGSGKGMGKGWRKGRTKALEESESVNREEERRRDRWATGDVDFGPSSIVAISSLQSLKQGWGLPGSVPTLGERLLANGPAAGLSMLSTAQTAAEQPLTSTSTSSSFAALHKRFPGRLADFIYYSQYSSFAPAFDTSRSSRSGEGSAALWWTARQSQNRLRRFHAENTVPTYALPEDLERAFGGTPAPPPTFADAQMLHFNPPTTVLDNDGINDALLAAKDVRIPGDEAFVLDPRLWQTEYARLAEADGSAQQGDINLDDSQATDEMQANSRSRDIAAERDDDDDDGADQLAQRLLQQNQELVQALVVLQGQRLLTQVRRVEDTSSGASKAKYTNVTWEALPVERLIDEPAYWGTLAQTQYTQQLPLLLIDQVHREAGRKGPLVLKDNTSVMLTDKTAAQPLGSSGPLTAFSPIASGSPAAATVPLDAYGRPAYGAMGSVRPGVVDGVQHATPAAARMHALGTASFAQAPGATMTHPHAAAPAGSAYGSPVRTVAGSPTGMVPHASPYNHQPTHAMQQHQHQQQPHQSHAQHFAFRG
ncbi:hypothetical protein OC834_005964 [Tilletia horrida]|nr:hypothetical protein OC834_005964 [Tilletia horrida]KAK0523943.1 hypothetical protein OC835_006089 [Tilletia horrida]